MELLCRGVWKGKQALMLPCLAGLVEAYMGLSENRLLHGTPDSNGFFNILHHFPHEEWLFLFIPHHIQEPPTSSKPWAAAKCSAVQPVADISDDYFLVRKKHNTNWDFSTRNWMEEKMNTWDVASKQGRWTNRNSVEKHTLNNSNGHNRVGKPT